MANGLNPVFVQQPDKEIAERIVARAIELAINPPIITYEIPGHTIVRYLGQVTASPPMDRGLLPQLGNLRPSQSDTIHGRFTKCRRVKGGFRVTKRFVIWS